MKNPLNLALVADAPTDFRSRLVSILENKELQVVTTSNGHEAYAFVLKRRPSILFINAFLEGMLGCEAIDRIRANSVTEDTHIVLIGAIFRSYRYHAVPKNLYGADAYIEEGIQDKELMLVLDALLENARKPAASAWTAAERFEQSSDPFEEARTLARIIISDIYIYQPVRGHRAILKDKFREFFAEPLRFGENYFNTRIPETVRRKSRIFEEAIDEFIAIKRKEYLNI